MNRRRRGRRQQERTNQTSGVARMARPSSGRSQSEARGRPTRRHSNQLASSLRPALCHRENSRQRKHRPERVPEPGPPHAGRPPMTAQHTDKDIPRGTPRPITGRQRRNVPQYVNDSPINRAAKLQLGQSAQGRFRRQGSVCGPERRPPTSPNSSVSLLRSSVNRSKLRATIHVQNRAP